VPRKTQLYDRHLSIGARMIEFAGWLLPVQYPTGPKAEHLRVRESAGFFDIDHMGQLTVTGPDALPFLQRVMTADIAEFSVGTANYSLMCYDDGGVVDDTFIYRLPDRYFVVVNASNNRKDTSWLNYHRGSLDVSVENVSDQTYMVALQGPMAQTILQPLCDADLARLEYHAVVEGEVLGARTVIGRTGYTGEDGFELFFPTTKAPLVWDGIMKAGEPLGLLPIGLAARDSLRFEPCMPLYGQEISATTDPLEAGLGWAVAFGKVGFCGREALLKTRLEGVPRKLVGFEMIERGVPRHGYDILVDGTVCGEVTSGMYSPTLEKFLGLAYVPVQHSAIGREIGVLIRDKVRSAAITRRPFYVPAYRR
jgi:aminomethyltransferase